EEHMHQRKVLAAFAAGVLAVSACGGGSTPAPSSAPSTAPVSAAPPSAPASAAAPSPSAAGPSALGPTEGELNLIAWAGYVVGGTGGEQVAGYDWVTPF